jgi:hypothetical protein
VEEKKLQQPMNSGEEFFQEFFEERPISSIIPHPLVEISQNVTIQFTTTCDL